MSPLTGRPPVLQFAIQIRRQSLKLRQIRFSTGHHDHSSLSTSSFFKHPEQPTTQPTRHRQTTLITHTAASYHLKSPVAFVARPRSFVDAAGCHGDGARRRWPGVAGSINEAEWRVLAVIGVRVG